MKKPTHQIVSMWVLFAFTGVLVLGAVLDAFINAIEFVSRGVAFWGTIIIVCTLIALHIRLRRVPMAWVYPGGKRVRMRGLGPRIIAGAAGMTLLLWVPILIGPETGPGNNEVHATKDAGLAPASISSSTIPVDSASPTQQPVLPAHVALEYIRLFGAYQVPWVLDMITYGDEFTGDTAINFYTCREGVSSRRDPICLVPIIRNSRSAFRLAKWWANWPGHDAILFSSQIAACNNREQNLECPGTYEHDTDLVSFDPYYYQWLACGRDLECRRAMVQLNELSGDGIEESGISPESTAVGRLWMDSVRAQEMIDRISPRIGFLFLLLRNDSNVRLDDIQFQFTLHRLSPHLFPAGFDPDLGLIDPLAGLPRRAEVERSLDTATVQVKGLANLTPGQKVLWLLSIYRRDPNGFPDRYASSVVRPLRVSYRVAGQAQRSEMSIRAPLEAKVIRRHLPLDRGLWMGWRGQ